MCAHGDEPYPSSARTVPEARAEKEGSGGARACITRKCWRCCLVSRACALASGASHRTLCPGSASSATLMNPAHFPGHACRAPPPAPLQPSHARTHAHACTPTPHPPGSVSFVFSLHVQGKDLKKAREEEEEDRRREAAEMAELREREKKHASELAAASAQAGADGKENSQPARPVPGPVAAPLPLGKRALAGGRGMPFRAVLPPAKFGPAAGQHGKGAGAAARTGAKPKGKAGRDVSDSEEEASDESVAESEKSESDVEESESEAGSEVEVEEESRGGASPMDGAGMLGCASGDVAGGCAAAPVPSAPKPRPSKRLVIESDEEDSEGPSDGPQAGLLPPPPLQPPEPPRHTPAAHVQAAPVPGLGFADGRMPVAARADIGTKADGSGSSNGSSSTFGARKPGSKLSLSRKPQ